jgi:predicted nucleotidyltransferase
MRYNDATYDIREIKKRLLPVLANYSINKAVLFGSYAKGGADSASDVDILVYSNLTGLDFVGLIDDIQEVLEKNVDVIDISHVEKGSPIEREIQKTGVILLEKR